MRVLEVLPSISSRSGGPARSTLSNCRAVYAADPTVRFTLATTAQELDESWRTFFEAQMPPRMELRVYSAVGRHAFTFSASLAAWLERHGRQYDLLLVRTLFNPVSSTAAWIARRKQIPYVVVPHGTLSSFTFAHRRTRLKRAYYRLVEKRTVQGAAAVRATCRAELEELTSRGVTTPIRTVPHPYEPKFGRDSRSDLGRGQILFLSRLHPVKGIELLLEAVKRVCHKMPAARLVLAGSGTPRFERQLRSQIRTLELDEFVTLPGFVEGDEKARLLSESDVFVLASRHESFGVAVVEAMDAGLPVVISRNVGIWPEVEDAGAGIVLRALTPEALAEALLSLLGDGTRRKALGDNGRRLVRRAFDPRVIGRQLADLYRTAAGRKTDGHAAAASQSASG